MKEKTMKNKKLHVSAINPKTSKVWGFSPVSEDKLETIGGKLFYVYNRFQKWEVVEYSEIPQAQLDAEDAYFAKYGTACE